MNILFISDIHANIEALSAIEDNIKFADITICLGDIVGYHCSVNEVIDYLKAYKVKCIQGNHDRYLIKGLATLTYEINDSVRFGIEQAEKQITPGNYTWIKNLPVSLGLQVDDVSIYCCHGSPWDPLYGYIYAESMSFPKMKDFQYDIIALGHTHRQYLIKNGHQIIFNPGSVGQARDHEGKACATLLDTDSNEFQNVISKYNFRKTLKHSIYCGASDWIYKHFKTVL
jgi:putative phosphoesterase